MEEDNMNDVSDNAGKITGQHGADLPVRKRKRDTSGDEIEVDLNAPEPPSKKARRRAKKGRPAHSKEAINSKAISRHDASTINPPSSPSPSPSDFENPASDTDTEIAPKAYGVWIGNLPFTCTSSSLRSYLITASPTITDTNITRVHMPPPAPNPSNKGAKPHNKGFAYVDFTMVEAQQAAIKLSETQMGGRNLLIKSSDDFQGRPDKPLHSTDKTLMTSAPVNGLGKRVGGHPPSKRVFVGNLGYEMTKEDLQKNFEACGEILDIHAATFEDSGRSKGYAWVTFGTVEAAAAAVRGWCKVKVEEEDGRREDGDGQESWKTKNKKKNQKWFVNRIHGRQIRCEFAEDSAIRYKRRFGQSARDGSEKNGGTEAFDRGQSKKKDASRDEVMQDVDMAVDSREVNQDPDSGTKQSKASYRPERKGKKIDARTIPPGAALARAKRGNEGIVKSQGTKIVFD